MRLLSTDTRHFKEFFDPPKYAILSHRWGDHEVSYEDYCLALEPEDHLLKREAVRVQEITGRSGYAKIIQCCRLAREHGYEWMWVDTCCIDKRSSAELMEAINSMWMWYARSAICYVYLADVPSPRHGYDVALSKLHESTCALWA